MQIKPCGEEEVFMSQTTAAETGKRVPFGLKDKLAYAAGDFGCNMSFALKSYLTIYWTQYMGIDSVLLAGPLIVVQVWDAINDPLIGTIVDADRHQYKRNKFLAYISVFSCICPLSIRLCAASAKRNPLLPAAASACWLMS